MLFRPITKEPSSAELAMFIGMPKCCSLKAGNWLHAMTIYVAVSWRFSICNIDNKREDIQLVIKLMPANH